MTDLYAATREDTSTRERDLLIDTLGAQRAHVLGILEGLDPQSWSAAMLPSGWTFAGLLSHLTLDVERFWFRGVLGGQPDPTELGQDGFTAAAGRAPAEVVAAYRAEIAYADALVAGLDLDVAPAWWPEGAFGDWRLGTVREVLLHVITETACHAGHLDAARELVDGRTWLVLT